MSSLAPDVGNVVGSAHVAQNIARVIVNEPLGLLSYAIPTELVEHVHTGVPVRVPLGRRKTVAYVVDVGGEVPDGIVLRELLGLDTDRPTLPKSLIELVIFAADYYCAPYGDVLSAALPPNLRLAGDTYRISPEGETALAAQSLNEADAKLLTLAHAHPKGFTVAALERQLGWQRRSAMTRLKKHVDRGWLSKKQKSTNALKDTAYQRIPETSANFTPRQSKLEAVYQQVGQEEPTRLSTLVHQDPHATKRLRQLVTLGWIKKVYVERPRQALKDEAPIQSANAPQPTPEQSAALADLTRVLDERRFHTALLQGVTGSGKTEIYMRLIEHALAQGRTGLVLVPEIALTPQLVERFRSRFGGRVATFHSGLLGKERREEWERVAYGEAPIAVGARSALFLPLKNLGVIIVDEEHETSFKQEESPRYNARDLAVARGQKEQALVVLGSATPSLESRTNTSNGRYQLVTLKERVQSRPLPQVELLNLAEQERATDGVLTVRLARAIERTLSQDEQVILFLNRRGFAPYIFCKDCGHTYRCVDCDVALTLHKRRNILLCHYCAYEEFVPDECKNCSSHRVDAYGLGIERLVQEVRELYGDIGLSQLDRDTVRKRDDLVRELSRFRKGESKILIGTQMVTKGHDFPGVTLVGVVMADASLNFPDFRAAERTFQLLTQVAGRAGRGERPGVVLVQGYAIEHYAVAAAAQHDYETFLARELLERQELGYPPYTHMALVRCEGPSEAGTLKAAADVAEVLRERALANEVQILGPAPAPIARIKTLWRAQILLKSPSRKALRQVIGPALPKSVGSVRRILDVDPYSML